MSRRVTRGEIYFADLSPVVGSEQGGVRPVLIIQNNIGNRFSSTVIVAAISGKTEAKQRIPTHYQVDEYAGLDEKSLILLEQIRTIDKQRLQNYIGQLDQYDMAKVDRCLAVSLALKIA